MHAKKRGAITEACGSQEMTDPAWGLLPYLHRKRRVGLKALKNFSMSKTTSGFEAYEQVEYEETVEVLDEVDEDYIWDLPVATRLRKAVYKG